MITEIPRKGTSVAGLLHYLGGPHRTDARLLDTNLGGETHEDWTRQFESLVHHHAPRQNRIVKQMILSAAPEDHLSKDQWREIVSFYRERMGYAEAPFVAYLHSDPRRQHVHIVTTPTTWDGKRVSESWDWPRSEAVAREIERRWQLRAVLPSKAVRDKAPTHGEWRKTVGADEPSQRRAFQEEIRAIGERSRTVRDLFEGLEAAGFNVRVQVDAEGVLRGVSFARGDFAFRGSQLGRDLSGSKLFQTFGLSYDPVREAAVLEARREVRETTQPVAKAKAAALAQRPAPAPEPWATPAPVPVEPPRAGFPPDPAQERALLEEVGRLRRLFPQAQEDRAAAVQREALEVRPESTQRSRYSPLLAEVEQVRRRPEQADPWAELLSTRELIRGAYHHNREALREIDTGARPAYHPGPRSMLIAQEAQIEKNQRAAGAHLREVEESLGGRRRQLEGAAEQASREPGPASTRRWQEAVSEYRQALADRDRAERTYYGWLHVQAVLDRERARAALVSEPGAPAGRSFAAHVMRAERLALEARAYPLAGGRSPGAQGLPREEVKRRLEALGSGLSQGRLRPTQGEVREAARLYRAYQRFERSGNLTGATERSSRHAAQAVVREERSPSSLRRLYTALLREVRPEAVPPPTFAAPKGDNERLDRLEQMSDSLLRDAAELGRLGSKAPEALKVRLLGSTSEAVLLERLLDASDRQAQGIPNPGFAPPGTSPTLWRAAWLVAAHQRGLPVEQAAAHLANLPAVAVEVTRSPLAQVAATIALGAIRHYARKLQEELERSQSRTRSRGLTLG